MTIDQKECIDALNMIDLSYTAGVITSDAARAADAVMEATWQRLTLDEREQVMNAPLARGLTP